MRRTMDIMEKVAYLKGLMDGLDLDMDSKEGKVFGAMLDVLDEMAMAVSDLQDSQDEMEELVNAAATMTNIMKLCAPPAAIPSAWMKRWSRLARSSAPTATRSWSSILMSVAATTADVAATARKTNSVLYN